MTDEEDDGIISDESHHVQMGTEAHTRLEKYLKEHPLTQVSPTGRMVVAEKTPYGVALQHPTYADMERRVHREGQADPHVVLARELNNLGPDEPVTPRQRQHAKNINFGRPHLDVRLLIALLGGLFEHKRTGVFVIEDEMPRPGRVGGGPVPGSTEVLPPSMRERMATIAIDFTVTTPPTWPIAEAPPSVSPPPDPPRAFKKGSFFPPSSVAGKGPYNRPRRRR